MTDDCFQIDNIAFNKEAIYNLAEVLNTTTEDKEIIEKYIDKNIKGSAYNIKQVDCRLEIVYAGPYICPHGNKHENDNAYAYRKASDVIYKCRSQRCVKIVAHTYENQKGDDDKCKRLRAAIKCRFDGMKSTQNKQYLEYNIPKYATNEIVHIKSALGTGKTQFLAENIFNKHKGNIVMLSPRITFTQAIQARFGIESYQDIKGAIVMTPERRVII